ncbi:MAG: hypothetical protein CME25_08620 [Gemmatimonadetes bacterium]|nr:hypothetical protein [Gemmatimonadota bacterium]|tara:strand:+ start:144 stop:374 length:231 start_codon:yes stop_codon:yes gene_type:complete
MAYRAAVIGLGMMGSIADGFGGKDTAGFSPFSHADVYECHPETELVAGATRDCDRQRLFRSRAKLIEPSLVGGTYV